MINYYYNEDADLLELKVEGIIKIDDILEYYRDILNNDIFPKNLKTLIDCREATFNIKAESLIKTNEALNNIVGRFDLIKEAIVIESSVEAAIATIFEKINSNFENYSFCIFSSIEASKNWLHV